MGLVNVVILGATNLVIAGPWQNELLFSVVDQTNILRYKQRIHTRAHAHTHTLKHRQTGRQAGRQADRQTERWVNK